MNIFIAFVEPKSHAYGDKKQNKLSPLALYQIKAVVVVIGLVLTAGFDIRFFVYLFNIYIPG